MVLSGCLALALATAGQAEPFPTDQILSILKTQWLFRKSVDWKTLEPKIRSEIAAGKTDDDRAQVVASLFRQANDVHSSLHWHGKSYAHFEGLTTAEYERLKPHLERAQKSSGKPTGAFLFGEWGYVLIPSFFSSTPEGIAQGTAAIASQIRAVSKSKLKGWIIDLRLNTGGNVYPMLSGLGWLLGDSVVGGTRDAEGQLIHEWFVDRKGLFFRARGADSLLAAAPNPPISPEPRAPVAVLVGPLTISSGQTTALAFVGRPKTRLFGLPTGRGYTTTTTYASLPAQGYLNIAVGFMCARDGRPVRDRVQPDEVVDAPGPLADLASDPAVRRAISWLKKQ